MVTPDAWNKDITLPPGAVDPRKQQFHAFFQTIIDKLCEAGFADKATQNFDRTDRLFPDAHNFSSINIRRNGSIDDPPEKLEETRAWMLDLLPRLKEVFDPRVQNILKELQGPKDG